MTSQPRRTIVNGDASRSPIAADLDTAQLRRDADAPCAVQYFPADVKSGRGR